MLERVGSWRRVLLLCDPSGYLFLLTKSPVPDTYSPHQVDRTWGIWGSSCNVPEAIFYLLKGDYNMHVCHMQATGMLSKSRCESESLSSQMLGVTICACHSLVPQHAPARETPVQKPAVWGMLFPAGPHECDSNFGATSQSSTQASTQVAAEKKGRCPKHLHQYMIRQL